MGEGQAQTIGDRIYLIREALQTRRDPLPLDKFAALIAATTGVVWDKSTLSRMETGDRKVLPEDVAVIAQVDPLKRGRSWLAWGDEGGQAAPINGSPKNSNPPAGWITPDMMGEIPEPADMVREREERERRERERAARKAKNPLRRTKSG